EKKPQWLLIKERDGDARPSSEYDVTEASPDSVNRKQRGAPRVWHSNRPATNRRASRRSASGAARTMAPRVRVDPSSARGARRAAMPEAPRPELATLVDQAPEGEDWIHEIKYDGYRLVASVRQGRATLLTRTGQDWTERFAMVAEDVARLPVKQAVVDGEVV